MGQHLRATCARLEQSYAQPPDLQRRGWCSQSYAKHVDAPAPDECASPPTEST